MDTSFNNGEMWKCIGVSDTSYTWVKMISEDNREYVDCYPDWSHLKWYVMGDSLTDPAGGIHTSKFYYEYIAEKTGIQVIVDGLGGTGYHAGVSTGKRFADRVANIPEDVDIVTIFGSGNDVMHATPEEYKSGGAAAMAYFFNNRPGLPVIIVPPSPWATYGKRSDDWKNYCDTLELLALNYSLHYVGEMWTEPPFDPNSSADREAFFTKCQDGVHPDESGHRLLAPYFYNAMLEVLVFEGKCRAGEGSGQNVTNVFSGKTAAFYGDSITEQNAHYTKGYHAWVKELLGLASYNNYGTSSYKVSNVYSKVNEVSDTADIVFVMCGVNDQTFSVPLGAMGDTTTGTTYGSLHLLCNALKTKYPTSIIVFITPAYQTKYPHNSGVTSYEVSKAIKDVCEKYAIPVYDNFVLSGICDTNLSVFTTDNCHWNDVGHEMVGKNLAAYMLDTFHYVHGYTGDGAGGGETPDETDKTLTGISATYSGGSVPVGTAVTALTGVVVSAHYSDGSTATVTGYTLSGSIAEGENTVTVTYEGMTATFTVTGVAESDSTRIYAKDYDEEEGIWTGYGNIRTDLGGYTHTDYIPIGANVPFEIYTNLQAYIAFFDAEKKFISITNDGPPSQFTSVNGTTPANCAYFAFNMRTANRDQYYIEY